jgi:two-component system response regulator HydG
MRYSLVPYLAGESEHVHEVRRQIEVLGPAPHAVTVWGEIGTGKEVVARLLHRRSGRQRFVQIAGPELLDGLFGSQLFGHTRGAFTGACREHRGLLEEADGGTLFLDELGDLRRRHQASLLGVLEGRSFRRLGAERALRTDVRFVIGSQHDLWTLVERGRLREDLAHRLGYGEIRLLPLRERLEDVKAIAHYVLRRCAEENGKQPSVLSHEVTRLLRRHSWPGNVRELEGVLEWAAFLANSGTIQISHLPSGFLRVLGFDRGSAPHDRAAALRRALEAERGNLARAALRVGLSESTVRRLVRHQAIDLRLFRQRQRAAR